MDYKNLSLLVAWLSGIFLGMGFMAVNVGRESPSSYPWYSWFMLGLGCLVTLVTTVAILNNLTELKKTKQVGGR